VRAIASKLAVAHVLEGSVRKSGQVLRVTVQLIRATDGMHLWSKTYDRKLGNVFKMQDEIASAVTEALNTTLSLAASVDSAAPSTEAYNLVLQGDFLKSRFNAADRKKALEFYQHAIAIEPRYALAWARLGSTYFNQYIYSDPATAAELLRKAREALHHSLELDPKLIWGYYTSSGIAMTVDWDWKAVTAAFVRMYQLDPDNIELLASAQADAAGMAGDFNYALRLKAANLTRDPINPHALTDTAQQQLNLRQYQAALQTNQRLIDLDPKYEGVWTQRAAILLWSGRIDEALEAITHETDPETRLSFLTVAHWQHHEPQRSTDEWHELIRLYGNQNPYDVAAAAACRGDANVALEWLDRALSARDIGITGIKGDFCLEGLRDEARYKSLVERLGLDQIVYKSEDLRRLANPQASATKL
jgi:tetratricopeptide (TPR) repeat protein